jgi:acyl-CoA dehydrogenase
MDAPASARAAFSAWRERTARNWYEDDSHLRSLLAHHGLRDDAEELVAFGATCSQLIEPLVRENNRDENLPRLRRYDADGNLVEAIEHHPTYRQIGELAYRSRLMTLLGEPGQQLASLARMFLFAQNGEAGHACPMACTAGLIKVLRAAGNPRPDWMAGLLDPDYSRHLRGAQFLTEIQGGSDVGANAVVGRPTEDGGARLTGEKWFCSVIDADLFLVTARHSDAPGTGGLMGYVVPRRLDDGSLNAFRIRRLKYKLGTRSMASAEVDFEGAWGLPVGGFRTVMEQVISTSRLLNAVCCAAFLTRAAREATTYALHRTAFGQPIAKFPMLARRLADLVVDGYAARGLTFSLAALEDRLTTGAQGRTHERDQAALRMLVNLNKLWTAERCTLGVRAAIEVLGGNGAIEEFSVLPRLLRDAIVLEAWEGGHNVLCSQVLKDCERLRLHEPMFDWLAEHGADEARLASVRARFSEMLGSPEAGWHVRDLCEELRPVAQAAALTLEQRQGGTDPKLAVVVEHLLATTQPSWGQASWGQASWGQASWGQASWDPTRDRGLPGRVARLLA